MNVSNQPKDSTLKNLAPSKNLWVFGYGSLMWNPEFLYDECQTAQLFGFHRRLCLWSVRYRGTEQKPGLVVGMSPGGSCLGMAFRVNDKAIPKTLDDLFERELISDAYRPIMKRIHLNDGNTENALTFVSKPEHKQFAPKMSICKIAEIVSGAYGPKGSNVEYVINTAAHLEKMGIKNTEIHQVANQLQKQLKFKPDLPLDQ